MRVGVSLGAGGARGYAHIGVLKALEEVGIKPDLVNGSSMGAIIGGAYALYNQAEALEEIARQLFSRTKMRYSLFSYKHSPGRFLENWLIHAACDVVALRLSIFSHRRNQEALEFIFGDKTFSDTQLPFWAVATDLLSGNVVSIGEGLLREAILASISIPGIFPPVEREGILLADGGVLAEVPVQGLRQRGAGVIIAVWLHSGYVFSEDSPVKNGFSLLSYLDRLKGDELTRHELSAADFIIDIDLSGVDMFTFDVFEDAIAAGYKRTRELMPKLQGALNGG